jgi:hypothetical protein
MVEGLQSRRTGNSAFMLIPQAADNGS